MFETISETVEAYNETLNSVYEGIEVGGVSYDYAVVFEALDPIAYRCGWIDWCDAEGIDTDELEDDYTFERDRF